MFKLPAPKSYPTASQETKLEIKSLRRPRLDVNTEYSERTEAQKREKRTFSYRAAWEWYCPEKEEQQVLFGQRDKNLHSALQSKLYHLDFLTFQFSRLLNEAIATPLHTLSPELLGEKRQEMKMELGIVVWKGAPTAYE